MTLHGENRMPPEGSRILVAMSGGVDSAAVAALLVKDGYDCMGATLRLTEAHETSSVFEPCCGLEAAEDARRICESLHIPHRTLRMVEEFNRAIIDHFTGQYIAGRTPNPCIRCNRVIKFGLLFREAQRLGFDYVAMGHYARLTERNGRMALRRAAYRPKDQSYVLAPLSQAQLRRACFPLGDMTKEEARALALSVDTKVGAKAESQEICFVADRDYARIVALHRGPGRPGPIRNCEGKVIGTHKGIHHYTVGQRRGLGIGAERPLYVVRLEAATNTVIVGWEEQSGCEAFTTGPLFWGAYPPREEPFSTRIQIRYRHEPVAGTVQPTPKGAQVRLALPERAVTPGQWAVFYDEEGQVAASAEILDFE